jgi:hypothetical protein
MILKLKRSIIQVFILILVIIIFAGCSPNKVGKLVGVQVSIGLSDMMSGVIDNASYGGVVVVELDDGKTVDAVWDLKLGDEVTGGMKLEIAPTEDKNYWKVVKIIE